MLLEIYFADCSVLDLLVCYLLVSAAVSLGEFSLLEPGSVINLHMTSLLLPVLFAAASVLSFYVIWKKPITTQVDVIKDCHPLTNTENMSMNSRHL